MCQFFPLVTHRAQLQKPTPCRFSKMLWFKYDNLIHNIFYALRSNLVSVIVRYTDWKCHKMLCVLMRLDMSLENPLQ